MIDIDLVVKQAQNWGFNCELTAEEIWQITASPFQENWQLSALLENYWLLSINQVPQLNLSGDETLRFLEHRHRFLNSQSDRSQ